MKSTHRRAKPGARFSRIDPTTGLLVKLRADDLGVIEITDPSEQRVADAFGLPVTKTPRLDSDEVAKLQKGDK